MQTAASGSPYQVPPEPSPVSSTLLAVGMHAVLLGFLWIGIRWQNVEPVAVTAEVWDMQVQDAAPREPTPEPVPVKAPPPIPKVAPPPPPNVEEPVAPKTPDIALEREKKEKKLREQKLADKKLAEDKQKELDAKLLADKKAQEKADKLAKAAKAMAEEKLAQKLRDLEMKRILGGVAGAGEADRTTAPKVDNGYVTAVRNKIKRSTSFNGDTDVPGNPSATFKIEQLPTGEIISVRKAKGSGIGAFDDAVERGINNSSPLPKKKDGTVERTIEVTIRMKEVD
jgi:colicin import membrane protein